MGFSDAHFNQGSIIERFEAESLRGITVGCGEPFADAVPGSVCMHNERYVFLFLCRGSPRCILGPCGFRASRFAARFGFSAFFFGELYNSEGLEGYLLSSFYL